MTILIRGGRLISPTSSDDFDILIDEGRIVDVGPSLSPPAGATVLEANGCWVGPSFVDLHTHLREPGREEAETIESGARAAARGGYGALVAMPNTEPAIDTPALVTYVLAQGAKTPLDVAVAGAITQGRAGEKLAPMAEMAALGVRLFTDDGTGVQSPAVMRKALTYAKSLGVRLAQHCEDETLAAGGSMNEGALSSRLGLVGRPALAEELMVARDIELVRLTGCPLHLMHLSTRRSLELVRAARNDGLDITCEVTPHHLTLDESFVESYDPIFKVHPPLRARADVDALRAALVAGDVDAVATDHAPHAGELKDLPFDEAPAGMLNLEHAASLALEALGEDADPRTFFSIMSRAPARIAQLRRDDNRGPFGAHGGDVSVGDDANVVVFDPGERWRVDRSALASRATNTPYDGRDLRGRVRSLVVRGVLVLDESMLV
ncbi:MAG TPA: dihydroorotase [Acidimicrobiales bacterium]|jgi:dihydroorotase